MATANWSPYRTSTYRSLSAFLLLLALLETTLWATCRAADDVGLPSLLAQLQQQAATIQQQQATLQALLTRVGAAEALGRSQAATLTQHGTLLQAQQTKLAADEHTLALQAATIHTLQTQMVAVQTHEAKNVAFTATFASGVTANTAVNVGTHGVIKFATVIANTGNGYSSATGFFTAPVAGTYVFLLTIQADNRAAIEVELTKGGTGRLCLAMAEAPTHDWYDKGTCNAAVHLNAGEQVFARHLGGTTSLSETYFTSLTGFLVHAD